jgi:hypothetical protein
MPKTELSQAEIDRLLSRPTITAEELAGVIRTSRNGAYDAIRRGEVETIKVGRKIKVLTAPLRRQLGIGA